MATTLFDLEGKVSLNSAEFFTSAETVNTQIESLATAIGNLETQVSGTKISKILDTATFTAEQIVVTEGLTALDEKVGALKETFSAIDLGGTLLSTVTGGLAALAGNLLIGDIKVGLDVPTTDDINNALAEAVAHIEGLSPAFGVTLPDASTDPLASEIAAAGTGIVDALETACAWEIPVPTMPSVETVKNKIKAFWQIVTSGLNLSIDATVNIRTNTVASTPWNTTNTPAASTAEFWGFENVIPITPELQAFMDSGGFGIDYEQAVDFMTGDIADIINGKSSNNAYDTPVAENGASPLEEAVYSALMRWAQPVGGQALAAWMTPRVSNGIAQGTRGIR